MFASINSIQDIGNFSNQGYVRLAPVTLIYALNGHGKSTLADIFRSLCLNDPKIIINRKRISSRITTPFADLTFIGPGNEKKKINFDKGWNINILPFETEIFDSRFVEENVFTGLTSQRSNKINLTSFILGSENVKLGKKIEALRKQKKDLVKKRTETVTRLKKHIGNIDIKDFIQLPKPEQKEATEKILYKLWEEKERLVVMADKAGNIKHLDEPFMLSLPDEATGIIKETAALLNQDFDAVNQEAMSKLELHMEKNLKNRDGEENTWIGKGLSYIQISETGRTGDTCPFCGQSLDNAKDLLKTCQSFFGKAYRDYTANISRLNNSLLENTIKKLDDLRNDLHQNLNRLNRFKEYSGPAYTARLETADLLTTGILKSANPLKQRLSEIQAQLTGYIEEKLKIPFEPVKADNLNTQDISLMSDEIIRLAGEYNQTLKQLSELISELKQKADNPNLPEQTNKIRMKLLKHETELSRCEFDAEVREIRESEKMIDEITAEINSKQQELEKMHYYFTNKFFSYVGDINNYINPGSGFQVKSLLDSRGYQPVCFFQVSLREKLVGEKSFPFVLSDGDRRTLAFSIFFGNLKSKKQSNRLSNTMVILDDPVVALDEHRISSAVPFIRSLMNMCRQVIVMSHSREFLQKLHEPLRDQNNVSVLSIQKDRHQSVLKEIKDFHSCEGPHTHDIRVQSLSPAKQPKAVKKYDTNQQGSRLHKQIVCLAASRKYSGYCVAGKELSKNWAGKWVRPVSARETGELQINDIIFENRKLPKLLDIITLSLTKHNPHFHQTENYETDETRSWIKKGELSASNLSKLCDNADVLWINGYNSRNGLNDRIPREMAENDLSSSLLLIRPDNVFISVRQESYDKRIRAGFDFKNIKYCLSVTDPVFESKYLKKEPGEYPLATGDLYFCVSIGEPFEGYCYKLVAGIIG
ncbi:MAG: AAA family ATPase [Desulfobacteraceae bacterium]|nr:AAA family ATPase [Desulfobacteraceae bacterium]